MNRRNFLKLSLASPFVLGALEPKISGFDSVTPSFEPRAKNTQDKQLTKAVTIRMKVTAYCPCSICCGSYSDNITASGYKIIPKDKFVAADKRYPFGTMMHVPEYCWVSTKGCDYGTVAKQTVYVKDRGGAIKGNHIDVFFPTHQEALNWGVKYLDVIVYDFQTMKMRK